MQKKSLIWRLAFALLMGVIGMPWVTLSLEAASQIWNGGSGVDGNWSTVGNWAGGAAPGATVGTASTDIATFNSAIANTWGNAVGNPVVIDAGRNVNGITFDTNSGSYFIGSTAGNSIQLTSGATIQSLSTLTNASVVTETINAPLVLNGATTIQNNSGSGAGANTGILNIGGGITGGVAGATTLTLAGSNTNANTLGGIIGNGASAAVSVTKNEAGSWTLGGVNTYTGTTTLNAGTLISSNVASFGTSAIQINGGTLDVASGAANDVPGNNMTINASSTLLSDRAAAGTGIIHTFGTLNVATASTILVKPGSNVTSGTSRFIFGNTTVASGTIFDVESNSSGASILLTFGALQNSGDITFLQTGNGSSAVRLTANANAARTSGTVTIDLGTNSNAFVQTLSNGATSTFFGSNGVSLNLKSGAINLLNDASIAAYNTTVSGNFTVNAGRQTAGAGITNTFGTLSIGSNTLTVSNNDGVATSGTSTIVYGATTLTGNSTFNVVNGALATVVLNLGAIGDGGSAYGVTKTGTGTLTLSGANTYSGGTTLSAGTIKLSGAGTLGATSGLVTVNGGTLDLNGVSAGVGNFTGTGGTILNNSTGTAATLTIGNGAGTGGLFQGVIADHSAGTGTVALTKTGSGTISLSGANTYTGATTISAGTLKFTKEVALYNNTSASWTAANVIVNSGATLGLNVGGTGEFTSADLDTLLAIGTAGGGFKSGSFVGLDTSNASGGNFTYASAIANTNAGANILGLTKSGTGSLTLTGTNTATGLATVDGGTLVIGTAAGGNWAGSVAVNSGGTLKGRGTIGGSVTVNSGGTYAPGNSPAIQAILGNLTLASGSRTEIEIDGANPGNGTGFHDQINVTGTVNIQGGTIAPMTIFSGSSGYVPTAGQRFSAITGGSVTGQFSTIDNSANPAGLSFMPEYTSTNVYLRTTFSNFSNNPLLGLSSSQSAVGSALDSFRPAVINTGSTKDSDKIYNALTQLTTGEVKKAIEELNPQKLEIIPQLSQSVGTQVHSLVGRQLEVRRNLNPAYGNLSIYDRNGQTVYEPVAAVDTGTLFIQKKKFEQLSFFATVSGEQGEVSPSQGRTNFDYWSATTVYGGNYALSPEWNFGLFTGYGHADTSVGGAGGKIFYNSGKIGGYASWNHDDWFAELSSSLGKGFYDTRRNISFLSEQARGDTEGWESVTELKLGKDLSCGKWTFSPSILGRYSRTLVNAYNETGSAARLHIGPMDQESAVSGAGLTIQRAFPMGKMSLVPRVFANYEREWVQSSSLDARFAAGGSSFKVYSDPIDPDSLTAGVGTSWVVSDNLQWDVAYEREALQNDLQRQSINLSCKVKF
ncbi:MAG: autotransporter domain-containing protein [Verrucomicrobiota bacterium]